MRYCILPFLLITASFLSAEAVKKIPENDSRYRWVKIQNTTQVKLPHNYRPRPYRTISIKEDPWTLTLYSNSFSQGEVIYVEITATDKAFNQKGFEKDWHRLIVDGRAVPLDITSFGYRAFLSISPLKRTDGLIQWQYHTAGGYRVKKHTYTVYKTNFPVYKSSMNLGKYSDVKTMKKPEVLERIRNDRKLKLEAFSQRGPLKFTSKLAHARDNHYVTSPFYSTRITSKYEIKNGKRINHKPSRHIHRGLDLRGRPGDTVMAMADGTVILAANLFYEGNFVMINHGHGWISGYMHLNRIFVKKGDTVQAGDIIAEPGATGAVTGAHLHWALWHNGIPLQPISLLGLPVRD